MATVREIENDSELKECQRIRIQVCSSKIQRHGPTMDAFCRSHKVFVHGQGVPAELELEYEDECVHFLAFNSEQQPVGTGRLREVDDLYIKFERLAVLEEHQRKGYGAAIMQCLQKYCETHKSQLLPKMHAQVHAMPFYEGQGWKQCGEQFDEAGIAHVTMIRPPEDPQKLVAYSDDRTPSYITACLKTSDHYCL